MTERVPYTPKWLDKGPAKKRPRYLLRLATVLERDEFDAELDAMGCAEVHAFQMRDVAIEGIRALVEADDADELVQLVESEYAGEELTPAEKSQAKEVIEVLEKHWPDYQALRERTARRDRILPGLAFAWWVDGWENVAGADGSALEYARGAKGEIPDELLRALAPVERRAVGIEAYRLQYGRSEAKNSAPPLN